MNSVEEIIRNATGNQSPATQVWQAARQHWEWRTFGPAADAAAVSAVKGTSGSAQEVFDQAFGSDNRDVDPSALPDIRLLTFYLMSDRALSDEELRRISEQLRQNGIAMTASIPEDPKAILEAVRASDARERESYTNSKRMSRRAKAYRNQGMTLSEAVSRARYDLLDEYAWTTGDADSAVIWHVYSDEDALKQAHSGAQAILATAHTQTAGSRTHTVVGLAAPFFVGYVVNAIRMDGSYYSKVIEDGPLTAKILEEAKGSGDSVLIAYSG
jgi:hypothetical protein